MKASRIHTCASLGDYKGVRAELEQGISVDSRDEKGDTPLAHAARSHDADEEMLQLLMDAGADPNAVVGKSKRVPIGLAASSGNLGKVQCLLNAGADINFVLPKGYTSLIHVIHVIYALHHDEQLMPVVEYLVRNGAATDCVTDYGESALGVASYMRRFDVVQCLLDAGTDPSPLKWTELMKAIALGTREEVETLLKGNCGFDDRDSCDRTPWLLAIDVEEVPKARLLHSIRPNLNERRRGGDTALIQSAALRNAEMLQWLIEIGAETEAVNDAQNTALHQAARAGATDCVQLLLNAGVDPSRRNEYEQNAILLASNEQIVRLLTGMGEDVGDINKRMKRILVGLHGGSTLNVSQGEYHSGRRPKFGHSNPEVMQIPFWDEMLRSGFSAHGARRQFGDTGNIDGPIWCFSRYGTSFTELPDGRFIQIGGEHEDFSDPDFCIYNDVIIHEALGIFQIMGYPKDVFPPIDFHSATSINGFIYMIGGLGYQDSRKFGTTPIFRLNCSTWEIERMQSFGENPGWIYKHKASSNGAGQLLISGGKVCIEVAGEEEYIDNQEKFRLNLSTMTWTRV